MMHDAIVGLAVFSAAGIMAVLLIHGRAGRIRPPNWILAGLIPSAAAVIATGVPPGAAQPSRGAGGSAAPLTIDAANMEPGALPDVFGSAKTGKGVPAEWKVVPDASAEGGKALAQVSTDRTDYRFPLAIYKPLSAKDVEATVHCKPVAGKVDQACGVAVRLTSPDDYYIARANALEDNVRFYRVVKGKREQIQGANLKVASNQWHTLGLRAEGDRFTVSFDGKELFSATDKTFAGPGSVALWTKADSVTHFDRISIRPLP
jgi:hypothetical protein